ncbi:latrotoxin-related protein, partial [Wolbachia endosymbiont of Bemisia tabaci]|uniref:latrotoxin-related protein n=1 Tax=Wolbachia endosymbiont of Bemisia tabaci TaxID=215173 RepID=UPI0015D08C34
STVQLLHLVCSYLNILCVSTAHRKLLAIDLGNQPERQDTSKGLLQNDEIGYKKATSEPTSWINVFANTMVGGVKGISQFISSFLKPAISMAQPSEAMATQGIDTNGTLLLLDVFIRKIAGQKYISTVDRSISLLEAQGYALNIIGEFEKVVNQAALRSGISMHRLNIDFVGMQKEVTKKIMGGKFDEISGIVKSQIEKACPGGEAGCPGKLSPKNFDKFIAQFSKGLLNQSIHQMLHNENNALKMDNIKEPQSSGLSGPRTRLNYVLIASNTRELVAGRR